MGLYTAAIKINKLIIMLINSLGVVLIPRLSFYIESGEKQKTNNIIVKAYNYGFLFSIPAFIGLFTLSDNIILFFSGAEFSEASITMRILTPIVLVIPFSVMTNQQTLIPMGKEKLILLSSCAAAFTNIVLNFILIPKYAENGAAFATVMAESVAAIISFINAKNHIGLKNVFNTYYQYWIASFPIILIKHILDFVCLNYIIKSVMVIILSAIIYCSVLVMFKNQYLMNAANILYARVKAKNNNVRSD